jgi:hypothetical protein
VAVINRHHNHGVGSAVLISLVIVLAEEHYVKHLAVLQKLSAADCELRTAAEGVNLAVWGCRLGSLVSDKI